MSLLEGWLKRVKAALAGSPSALPRERRIDIRVECSLSVVAKSPSQVFPAVIRDLSQKGLRLEHREPCKKGDVLELAPAGPHTGVRCQLVWTRKGPSADGAWVSGLRYIDPPEQLAGTWIRDKLLEVGAGRLRERRTHLRIPSKLQGGLQTIEGEMLCEGTLLNVGMGGALLASGKQVPAGTRVRVWVAPDQGYPELDLLSTVRSSRRDARSGQVMHGIRFDITGDPKVVRFLAVLTKR